MTRNYKLVDELWDLHQNETIYIVGTGPSLQVFPKPFLEDKIVILLKRAWQQVKYNTKNHYILSSHVEDGCIPSDYHRWKFITKYRKAVKYNLRTKYGFYYESNYESNLALDDFNYLVERQSGKLYQGRGAQTPALCLAAHMGAKTAVLVGCDMCQLGPYHHGVFQNFRFHGLDPEDVYEEYYRNTTRVRTLCKTNFNMDTLSISPFLGLKNSEVDFRRLKAEYDLPDLPVGEDISAYKRLRTDNFK